MSDEWGCGECDRLSVTLGAFKNNCSYPKMLTITDNTLLKPSTKQADAIAPHQLIPIFIGKQIAFDKCDRRDNHFCFAETFYVFREHIDVTNGTIKATTDTWLKPSKANAADTPQNLLIPLKAGKAIAYKTCDREGSHWRVVAELCVFADHADVEKTAAIALTPTASKKLVSEDYERVAEMIGCNVAAVRAVVAVEAAGSGFLADGRPKILFEAHHFSRLTGRRFNASHPNLSSNRWNRSLYKGGAKEWDRMAIAVTLDRTAALKSASWGLGQVMGSNHHVCGHDTVQSFVNANFHSEGEQLKCMFEFIKTNRLDRHLRSLDFTSFARGYNGSGFAVHGYHIKLDQAYRKYARK